MSGREAPPLSVSAKFARDRASVYGACTCEPRPNRLTNWVCSEWYVDSPLWSQKAMLVLPNTPNGRSAALAGWLRAYSSRSSTPLPLLSRSAPG